VATRTKPAFAGFVRIATPWALILKPDNEIAYFNLSLTLHRLHLYNTAIAAANRAAVLEPNNPHPLVSGAIAYWDNGSKSLAQNLYRQAIKLDARYQDKIFIAGLKQAAFNQKQIDTTRLILTSLNR
jgi:tetratricopeptide (TPR) repeat protein